MWKCYETTMKWRNTYVIGYRKRVIGWNAEWCSGNGPEANRWWSFLNPNNGYNESSSSARCECWGRYYRKAPVQILGFATKRGSQVHTWRWGRTKDIIGNPDFGSDFLLPGKGVHLLWGNTDFKTFVRGCIVELYQFHCNNEHRNNEIDTMGNRRKAWK